MSGMPNVRLTPFEGEVVKRCVKHLVARPDVYAYGDVLAQISPGGNQVRVLTGPRLRTLITDTVMLQGKNRRGDWCHVHPPSWLTPGIEKLENYPGARSLTGLRQHPVFRADGSFALGGWDAESGLYISHSVPAPPAVVGLKQAREAASRVLEPFDGFLFEDESCRSALLAYLLTPLVRHRLDSAPLTLVDSQVPGAGKGLAVDTCAAILLGRRLARATLSRSEEEIRKALTARLLAGEQTIFFDNLHGAVNSEHLNMLLTGQQWTDRILNTTTTVSVPCKVSVVATAVRVVAGFDLQRRTLLIRLATLDAHPEDRSGFKYPRPVDWAIQHRDSLLGDLMMILAGYHTAGRPAQQLPAWGSFEDWMDVVAAPIAWLGLPEPSLARWSRSGRKDALEDRFGALLAQIHGIFGDSPFTSAGLTERALQDLELRESLEALIAGKLKAQSVGYLFRDYARFSCAGFRVAPMEKRGAAGNRWQVLEATS